MHLFLSFARATIFSCFIAVLTACGGGGGGNGSTIGTAGSGFILFFAQKSAPDTLGIYKYDLSSKTETNLSGQMNTDRSVAWVRVSPDSRWVAFTADREADDVFELYVVSIETGIITKVSAPLPAFADAFTPAWSPDSQQIAYVSDRDQDDIEEVYLVNRDGSNHRKISGSVGNPAIAELRLPSEPWSPDGRYIAQTVFSLEMPQAVIGINTHDTQNPNSVRVTPSIVTGGGFASFPRWLPDGSRLIYHGDFQTAGTFQLDTVRPDGSGRVTLTSSLFPGLFLTFQESPDSSTIAYKGDDDTTGLMELFGISPDGSNKRKLSGPIIAGGEVSNFRAWSPDSRFIAYTAQQESLTTELFTSSSDGITNTKMNAAPSGGFTTGLFRWSPDSQRLSYRNRFAPLSRLDTDLSTIKPDGSDNIQVSGDLAVNGSPLNFKWAPDNSKIAFVTQLNGIQELRVVSPMSNDSIKVNGALVTNGNVDINRFEWSRDSSRVAYIANQDNENTQELYLSTADGLSNEKISGTLAVGGNVIGFSWHE